MLNKALIFAVNVHAGNKRKGSDIPYILHPMEAAIIVSKMTKDIDLIASAILHDTVEDGEHILIEDIKTEFGERIAGLVAAETEDKTKSWQERKSHTLSTLENESEDVKIVALGDKLSNIRAITKDYSEIGDELWKRFKKGKEMQGWYYKGLGKALSSLRAFPEWQEFNMLVKNVFGE